MSGSAGIRGYLLQTLTCLLDALQNDNQWESLTLEPNIGSEKVDIAWYYTNSNEIKVTQVNLTMSD